MSEVAKMIESISLEKKIELQHSRSDICASWIRSNIRSNPNNNIHDRLRSSTINSKYIIKAANSVSKCLSIFRIRLKVLEVMSGNCVASQIFRSNLDLVDSFVCTDAVIYKSHTGDLPFECLNTVEAIEKYGSKSNVLLIISPPPYNHGNPSDLTLGHADYFAYIDFIDGTKIGEIKFIIIIGELGRSDGTCGTYRFLMEHKNLTFIHYDLLSDNADMFGGFVKKELYIFIIQK
jgi:hypothetical protein